MNKNAIIVAFAALGLFGVSVVLMFQNFTKVDLQDVVFKEGTKAVKTWEARSLKASRGTPKPPLIVCPDDTDWVVVFKISGAIDGELVSGHLINEDSGRQWKLDSVRIPHTEGPCQHPAESGEIKLCARNESGYMYQLQLQGGSRTYDWKKDFEFAGGYGCEENPQIVRVTIKSANRN